MYINVNVDDLIIGLTYRIESKNRRVFDYVYIGTRFTTAFKQYIFVPINVFNILTNTRRDDPIEHKCYYLITYPYLIGIHTGSIFVTKGQISNKIIKFKNHGKF